MRICLGLLLGSVGAVLGFAFQAGAVPEPAPSAELLFLTDDKTATGTPLLPGFDNDSVWSALGRASNGRIYIAASNHQQPGGNVAIYRYDPATHELVTLGDIQAISSAVGNWMPGESQYKAHTFLLEHADGKLYFASDDHDPSPFLRGAHLYRIDPTTDAVEDYSQTTPFLMKQDLTVIPNTGQNAERSGIFIEYYGIKGIGLNPNAPDLLYAMTYPDGHLIQYRFSDGSMQVVGQSLRVSYAFYVSNVGDVYYTDVDATEQTLYKYDESEDTTSVIATGLPGADDGEIGAIAPEAGGRYVYFLLARAEQVYRLDTQLDQFSFFADLCGTNWWRTYNLHLSPDEQSLYFVSNNNDRSTLRRIDVATQTCSEVLDVDAVIGDRDLCFGGIGVWDADGHFYAPVWRSGGSTLEPALLKAKVEVPEPGQMIMLGSGLVLLGGLKRARERRLVRRRIDWPW
jgi:sugar lactone lactonase YvrE